MLPVVFSSITAFTAATVLLSYFTILTSSSPVHRQLQARQACVRTKLDAADISTPFALEIQNASYPDLHHRRMNFYKAGGGDNHLYGVPHSRYITTSSPCQFP